MTQRADFDKIELFLIRVLHTLITERSVSRAALRLHSTQPAVSAQLKRLRQLTGDPLLVRAGNEMTPSTLLHEAERLFSPRTRAGGFDATGSEAMFRIAASDYLDPLFLPRLVAHIKRVAPGVRMELMPLSNDFDYRRHLATGDVDLVIGNWLQPPGELHLGRLFSDEIVCLVADKHPAARTAGTRGAGTRGAGTRGTGTRGWTIDKYLACEHVAPMPLHPGAVGVLEEHLQAMRLERRIVVRASHFSLIPLMVADSLLVLTTGRLFCSRYVDTLPVRIVRCPVPFPPLTYYQLWHDLTHASSSMRWFREQVQGVARQLGTGGRAANGARAA
jgi:DNA-binding transcriptional LysR family regulator